MVEAEPCWRMKSWRWCCEKESVTFGCESESKGVSWERKWDGGVVLEA